MHIGASLAGARRRWFDLARVLSRALRDPPYRYVRFWWRGRKPDACFQLDNATAADRFPTLFPIVAAALETRRPGRLLSFGCSTGEEVFSLRAYFPEGRIEGIDINPGNIARCRRDPRARSDSRVRFTRASDLRGQPDAQLDAIFCNAVMVESRLLSEPESCLPHLRFENFASLVADFRRCLRIGGILMLRFSCFRLADTPDGHAFESIHSEPIPAGRAFPVYGADNRLMPGVQAEDTIFRRLR